MTTVAEIFVISKSGPEWEVPVEAWFDKDLAERRLPILTAELNLNDVVDRLSQYEIRPIPLRDVLLTPHIVTRR